jgi:hypothetical protein
MQTNAQVTARLATLDQLLQTTIPAFLSPPPARDTLRNLLDREKIPRWKPNALARRGGGRVYYSVSAVERLFRSRTLTPA